MARVKIEDLKPVTKILDAKEMKKLLGGQILYFSKTPPTLNAKGGSDVAMEELVLTTERIESE
jgi:hypothetical protein